MRLSVDIPPQPDAAPAAQDPAGASDGAFPAPGMARSPTAMRSPSSAARRRAVHASLVNQSLAAGPFDLARAEAADEEQMLMRVSGDGGLGSPRIELASSDSLPGELAGAMPTTTSTPKSPLQTRVDSPLLARRSGGGGGSGDGASQPLFSRFSASEAMRVVRPCGL